MEQHTKAFDIVSDEKQARKQKNIILQNQLANLTTSIREMLISLATGERQLVVYRQFKMYNDPRFNPYLKKSVNSNNAGGSQ